MNSDNIRITLVYDNTEYKSGLIADWGFSCLIEGPRLGMTKILFDTGADGSLLLLNMKRLNIKPIEILEIFISHDHHDHTNGLQAFLQLNKNAKVYMPKSSVNRFDIQKVIRIKEPVQIHENVFSTGELLSIEQSIVIKSRKGLIVITGCSHPGIANIIKSASKFGKIYALIGGLHGFNEFDIIKNLELVCPCHCTQFKSEIKSLYPEKFISGGVGKVIEIGEKNDGKN